MNLAKMLKKRVQDPPPTWKVIAIIYSSGLYIMSDGTTAKSISFIQFKVGDRVLVYKGHILQFKWGNVKPLAAPLPFPALIIAHIGETTGEFTKKYYDINGKETTPGRWQITDDGKYGLIWTGTPHDDPDDYEYAVVSPGLGIPAVANGQAAAKIDGMNARIILSTALEDEIFKPWTYHVVLPGSYDYTYNYLQLEDSLIFAPFRMKSKPFVCRYTADGVITVPQTWQGQVNGVMVLDSYLGDGFQDSLPMVKNAFSRAWNGDKQSAAISGDGAACAAINYYKARDKGVQGLMRADTFLWVSSPMAEPVTEETYHFGGAMVPAASLHRCANQASNTCYFNDGESTSGIDTIADDLKRVFGMTEDGNLDYVRMRKDSLMTTHNAGVYYADTLIEESGWEGVLNLFPADGNGTPIFIRKTAYQILHSHHGKNFDVVIYRKTSYISHTSELLPYKVWRQTLGFFVQIRKTSVVSETSWKIAVNGVVTELPNRCTNTEYQLTGIDTEYSGEEIETVSGGYFQRQPWCDVVTGDNLTRIFSTEGGQRLLIGFDVFPVTFRHDLQLNVRDELWGYKNLEAVYDASTFAFPPSSDGCYSTPKDRKWMLFDTKGNYVDIQTPKANQQDIVNRVNGLCLLEKES